MKIDLDKLKHEWKTFALNLAGVALGLHEAACQAGVDWTPFIPEKYRPYAIPVFATLSLALRQWRNK